VVGSVVSWAFVLMSRRAFFSQKADDYSVRERIFVDSFARLRQIPEYQGLECDPAKVGSVMLMLKSGDLLCVNRPGYYVREITRYRMLEGIYRRAANHPWDSVGPMPDKDEFGGVWTWNWFMR
jgi:hypothetical protein